MPLLTGKDYLENEALERNDPDTPVESENGGFDVEDKVDSPEDDTAPKDGVQPTADGTTERGTETPKRVRSDSTPIDDVDISAAKLGMTEHQWTKSRKLVVNAAKQGLAFSEGTTINFTEKKMVYKTAEATMRLDHPDGSKSDKFAFIGVVTEDPPNGTLIP
jgi:hypothetical protein